MYGRCKISGFNLGLVYYRQGKHKKAISKLEKAISLNPNFVKAYIILGRALINSGKINEAKKNFEKVLEIQPNQKESSYFLAMLNGETPNKPPREYVKSLFDGYSLNYDNSLLKKLSYKVPTQMVNFIILTYFKIQFPPKEIKLFLFKFI